MFFFYITACQHIVLHQIHQIIIFKKASYDPFKMHFCKVTALIEFLHARQAYTDQ